MRTLILLMPALLCAQEYSAVDALFEKQFREAKYPGLVYGIVRDGKLAHLKAFGEAKPDTIFRIASMTKSFTALAVLKLRDEGKLSLDDAIVKYIPAARGIRRPTADAPAITVRHLLTHGAGFPEDNPWGDRQLAVSDAELDAWLAKGLPFSSSTGTEYEYSNYGFALLGRIVQEASGRTYADYLREEILRPLRMTSTFLEAKEAPQERLAEGWGRREGKLFAIPSLGHGAFGAMGGLQTSAQDLAKYVAFHLSAWPPRDEAEQGPVKRSSVREMQLLQRAAGLRASAAKGDEPLRAVSGGYGFGLSVSQDCNFAHIVGHGGGLPGFGSYMMWLPDYGVGMFAMANLTYAGTAGTIRNALELLKRNGTIQARAKPVTPVLASMRDSLVGLWENPTAGALDAIAADNLYQDTPREMRLAEIDRLRAGHRNCKAGAMEPENWLRGRFRLECDGGRVETIFTLAPTMPPLIQFLQFRALKPEDRVGAPPRCVAQ
jgi:CubicO group peptidase (beta-lactamase class C family)